MKADYVIKNAWVYMTFRQCFEKRDVAVSGERIFEVSPEISYQEGNIIDGRGMYLIPGLVDIHMHIESSMTYPMEFSHFGLKAGTTTVVADAHEIANVFGIEGVRTFLEQKTELDIFYAIPSSVPATSMELETSGCSIGEPETEELLQDSRVLCLGEVMNFKSLVPEDGSDTEILRLIRMCQNMRGRDIRLEGHCPKISGRDLNRFIFTGVDADHTQQTEESVLEKTDLGMFLELQKKSLTNGVVETVCKNHLYENVALVTDDTMPDQLLKGQLNQVIVTAVKAGMPVEKAIYCATYTPARRMHLDDRGMIGPGKLADLVLLRNLEDFQPAAVIKGGKLVYQDQEVKGIDSGTISVKKERTDSGKLPFPPHFYHSVHCIQAEPSMFILKAEKPGSKVLANVMKISTFGTATEAVCREIPVRDGQICWQEAGLCLAAVFERYGKNGNIAYGLVEGGFDKPGAAATTWSHDSHNLLVLGNSPEDMALAQNRVLELQGGYVICAGGRVQAEARLNVGGIISDGPLEELAKDLGKVRDVMAELGYRNNNEIMSMSTLALPVSPSLKLTDYGMLEVRSQRQVPLIEEYL